MNMSTNPSFLSIASAVGHALFTGLWLGALLAIILFFIAERLRATNAATRHAMWYAGLIAIAAVPAASLAWSFDHAVTVTAAAEQRQTTAGQTPTLHATHVSGPTIHHRTNAAIAATSRTAAADTIAPALTTSLRPVDFTPYLLGALGIALLGALIGVGGIGLSLIRLLAVKRESRPFDSAIAAKLRRWSARPAIGREVALRVSQGLDVPAAVGFAHPAILVPASWPANLDVDELDSIIMHEYSHLRRCDDWWALMQRIAERAYWFNPALRFIAARANLEREIACDDWVVTEAANATSYAECLWRIAQFAHIPQPRLPVPAALVTRAQIVERIEHLMDAKRDSLPHVRPIALLAIVPLAALLLVIGVVRAPAVTITQAAPASSVTYSIANAPATAAVKPAHASHVVARQAWKAQPQTKTATQSNPAAMPASKPRPAAVPTLARSSQAQIAALPDLRNPGASQVALNGVDVRSLLQSCQGCDLSGKDLRNLDLHGLSLSGDDMSRVDLRGANLRGTRFEGVDLSGARLDGADLTDAEFSGSNVVNISWTGAILTNTKFQGIRIDSAMVKAGMLRHMLSSCEGCDMQGLDLHGTDLSGIQLDGADLSDADLRDANLSHAKLNGVDLKGARLDGTDLTDAELNGCDLTSVDLSHAKIQGLKLQGADLRGLHFSGLDVRGLTADGADLSGTSLAHVDLSGAHMDGSDFSNSDLTSANLSDGDFSGADFRHAHLDNADLRRANLCGYDTSTDENGAVLEHKKICADFSGATTQRTDLRGARICDDRKGQHLCSGISASDLRALSHSDLTGALLPDF
jgi:uncharacterized protein YjbI with pentapeptide repeats/beta-lactamase regulating signal transducer with metallopeptidase domain